MKTLTNKQKTGIGTTAAFLVMLLLTIVAAYLIVY